MAPVAPSRLVVGCMTGTSIDALDAAIVRITGHGLTMHAELIDGASWPLDDLRDPLRAAAEQRPADAASFAALALRFGRFHADRLAQWLRGRTPDLVCLHGQTVAHAPPVSWQLINPAPVAVALGVPVVSDLRQADLAAGGQGAPISPLADFILFRSNAPRAIINLGGFCNITALPACGDGADPTAILHQIDGFDLCACNHLLDGVARAALGAPFDRDGDAAAKGSPDPGALSDLVSMLQAQARAARSLGTGDEPRAWIEQHRARLAPADLAATAAGALAAVIARALPDSHEPFFAGGGTRNRALMQRLSDELGRSALTTEALAIPVELREAAVMAVLGALCRDRAPITLPRVTGCASPAPVAGVWVFP